MSEVWLVQTRWIDEEDFTVSRVAASKEIAQTVAAEDCTQPGAETVKLEWRQLTSMFDSREAYMSEYRDDDHDLQVIVDKWDVEK